MTLAKVCLQVSDEDGIFEDEIAVDSGFETSREFGIGSGQSSSVDLYRIDLPEDPNQMADRRFHFENLSNSEQSW